MHSAIHSDLTVWMVSRPAECVEHYGVVRAITIAQEQQAKSTELRATISLCRFWLRQGKQSEAH